MPESKVDDADLQKAHSESIVLRQSIDRLQAQITRRDKQISTLRQRHSDRLEEIRSEGDRALGTIQAAQIEEDERIRGEIDEISRQRDELSQRLALLEQAAKASAEPPASPPTIEESQETPPAQESIAEGPRSIPESEDSVVTSIRRDLPPPVSEVDLETLVRAVRDVIDEYADPGITASDLKPPLARLVEVRKPVAVEKLFETYDYAEGILDYVVRHEHTLRNRAETLLAGGTIDGVGRKKEDRQRSLDGLDKKADILSKQRPRLTGMVEALADAIGRMYPVGSTRVLTRRLEKERNPTLRREILRSLTNVQAHDAIPFLIARLTTGQDEYRAQLIDALRKITGEDAGSTRVDWDRWWKVNANRFKEV